MKPTQIPPAGPSHSWAREKFDLKSRAETYPSQYESHRHDRREKAFILEFLKSIPSGSRVLDIPCGTGRLSRLLVERGYHVTGADAAGAMLDKARENHQEYGRQQGAKVPSVQFELRDVLATGYPNDSFDAITCIRLFHHFYEPETRVRALCEQRRICRGPIVLTFRKSFALDYVRYWLKSKIRIRTKLHMLPISMKTFAAEIATAGLQIDDSRAAQWGISSRWFLLLSRREVASKPVRSDAA